MGLPHDLNHEEIDSWCGSMVRKLALAMAYWMKAIHKRLDKLELRCGIGAETQEQRRWRERFEKFKRRLAADRVSRGLPPEIPDHTREWTEGV